MLKELPDKLVQDYECELSDGQRKLYEFVASRCTSRKCEVRVLSFSFYFPLISEFFDDQFYFIVHLGGWWHFAVARSHNVAQTR